MAERKYVPDEKLVGLDFAQTAIQLGADVPTRNGRWMPLDEQDMRILYHLLTKPLLADGACAADASRGLRVVTQWLAAGIQWYARQKDITPQPKNTSVTKLE